MSNSSGAPISLTYSLVPFEPIEEKWNTYSFSDGTVVRFRVILTRVTTQKGATVGPYEMSFQQICQVEAPPSDRGQPKPFLPGEVGAEKYEVKPTETIEEWNIYRIKITDQILKVKYVVSAFYRVRARFDQFGEPVYAVSGSPIVTPQPKTGKQLTT
ncbi:MAG: hypothetical protein OK455_10135 [Thaumarchaeota archaeon]|nr:hypothetical protein [Nitrososphaerota archaeon]